MLVLRLNLRCLIAVQINRKSCVSQITQICDVISTHPLPMTVKRITGRGELFDRGDPVPNHVTIQVEGSEGPLVERLRLNELLSAALAERAHRRNDQASRTYQF